MKDAKLWHQWFIGPFVIKRYQDYRYVNGFYRVSFSEDTPYTQEALAAGDYERVSSQIKALRMALGGVLVALDKVAAGEPGPQ